MMNKAIGDVINERKAQVTRESHLTTYDDTVNRDGQMAAAAAVYALSSILTQHEAPDSVRTQVAQQWPWSSDSFKPKSQREDLVRAAALIIAEIERLDRKNNC